MNRWSFSVHSIAQLGTSYVVVSFAKLTSDLTGPFCIIGTTNGTQVRITGVPRVWVWRQHSVETVG